MKLFIGTNFFTMHDSSMYILNPQTEDIFAMSTERLTRYKHDGLYPIDVCTNILSQETLIL